MYSLDFKDLFPLLAPDGLTIIIIPQSSFFNQEIIMPLTSYSWNHDTAQFHSICFDDQVHISWYTLPQYSPNGELFAYLSEEDSYVRVWNTLTSHLLPKFPTSKVDGITLSSALTHSLGKTLIALNFGHECVICLFDVYTGHLHAQILGKTYITIAFI